MMGTRELVDQARNLSPAQRLELVDALLHSLDNPDPTIDAIWLTEAEKRLAAYRSGKIAGIPAEEILGSL
jgi:putative addiction module component (TIGR02574 family)